MMSPFQRLYEVLAGSSHADLRRQVQFLKAENQVLRARLGQRVRTTPPERARLVRLGLPLGAAIKDLITIVSPRTFAKWVAARTRSKNPTRPRGPGRPPTPDSIRRLVLRIARQTDWGYTRIVGELKKLGVSVSRSTVINILKEAGLPTGPQRGEGSWDQFIMSHAQTLWACDFVSKRVWTLRGLVDAFVLVFIHVGTRRVHISISTTRPDAAWAAGQADELIRAVGGTGSGEREGGPRLLIRDRDSKFGGGAGVRREGGFDDRLGAAGVSVLRLPVASPNLNAYAERFIQTLQRECLDRFIVLGTSHLDYLVREYADYYNRQRPHSGIQFRAPCGPSPPAASDPPRPADVRCRQRLGGVVKHFYRSAA